MKVVHLFDRYLNSTMNWAYHLIRSTPDTEVYIASALLINNQFRDPGFHYLPSPFQGREPEGEWEVRRIDRLVSKLSRAQYQKHLLKQFNTIQPDLLHAHFANVGCRYLDLVRESQIPLVVSFYGYDYEKLPHQKPQYLDLYRELFEVAARLICEGPHGASILKNLGAPPEKIAVVPLGVRVEEIPFSLRTKPTRPFKILQAATFTEKKGQWFSLQAFHQALGYAPQIELTFLGETVDRRLRNRLETWVKAYDLEDRVHFQDFVPYDQFHTFLEQFDLFIHPSCYAADRDCEGGAPIVLLDVQAHGMPVVATRHCDIPEEVIHGKTGWLSAEKDIDDISRAIRFFYDAGPETYAMFSRAARQHVSDHFSIEKSGIRLRELYQAVL